MRPTGSCPGDAGPETIPQFVAAFSVEFREGRSGLQLEARVARIEAGVKQAGPDVATVFVSQSAETWSARVDGLRSQSSERGRP